ncbi:hypothetical protein GY45DRAFT_71592 [Cubamyces sp. BRFM 1775]|nr:hypothetical protein GY45DRAFT_71592 [Cubamyces sp. BRFM 1775]
MAITRGCKRGQTTEPRRARAHPRAFETHVPVSPTVYAPYVPIPRARSAGGAFAPSLCAYRDRRRPDALAFAFALASLSLVVTGESPQDAKRERTVDARRHPGAICARPRKLQACLMATRRAYGERSRGMQDRGRRTCSRTVAAEIQCEASGSVLDAPLNASGSEIRVRWCRRRGVCTGVLWVVLTLARARPRSKSIMKVGSGKDGPRCLLSTQIARSSVEDAMDERLADCFL